jgi:hypothetical protein
MTFYATIDADSIRSCMPSVPYLLPASSWARYHLRPVRLPPRLKHLAADCGGFVATRIWGDYRFSPKQYVSWLHTFQPEWAATMDYCCEDEITAGKPGLVRERQARTTQMAWYFWQRYRLVPWVWVPTIQGWLPDDYQQHARAMKPLIHTMQAFYARTTTFRVGIGTLCRRASTGKCPTK